MDTTKRDLRSGLAIGLCVAGTLTVATAAWILPDDRGIETDATTGLGWLAALAVIVTFVMACYWWTGERGRTVPGLLGALTFAGIAVRCGLIMAAEHGDGLVGRTPLVASYGSLLGLAGAILVLVLSHRSVTPAGGLLRRVGAALGVAIVLFGAGFALPTPLAWGEISHPSAALHSSAIPNSISGVAWTSSAGARAYDVDAVTGGVAVLTDAAVWGIDGDTGERAWSFARPGAILASIQSNGGSRVLVTWRSGGAGTETTEYLTVLDGATGRVIFTRPQNVWGSGHTDWRLVGRHALVVHNGTSAEITGYSLDTGKRRWSFPADKGCEITAAATRTAFGSLVEQQCGAHGELISLSDAGTVQWRLRTVMDADSTDEVARGLALSTNLDGTLVSAGPASAGDGPQYLVIDARTGRRVAERPYGRLLLGRHYTVDRWTGAGAVLRDVRTGEAVDAAFDMSPCDGGLGAIGADLRGGVTCLSRSSLASLQHSGDAVVTMQAWSGTSNDIAVHLGAPVDTGEPRLGKDATLRGMLAFYAGLGRVPLRIIAAPGAVVVWAPSTEGGKLVGLR